MYIYKVTHTPTGQYYIGVSKRDKDSFNDRYEIDPMGFFNLYESNGYGRNRMVVCWKSLFAHSDDSAVLDKMVADFAKAHESNPNFLGLKLKSKADEAKESKKPTARSATSTTTTSTEV